MVLIRVVNLSTVSCDIRTYLALGCSIFIIFSFPALILFVQPSRIKSLEESERMASFIQMNIRLDSKVVCAQSWEKGNANAPTL